jgi:hypothetical protein
MSYQLGGSKEGEHQYAPLPIQNVDDEPVQSSCISRHLYEALSWTIIILLTVWAVVDRFTCNLFPMTINFHSLEDSLVANGVFVSTAVFVFDIFGRVAGRMALVSFNVLFWTECKTTEAFLMEHHPSWMDMSNLPTVHKRIHKIVAVVLFAAPMVLHVVFVFLPSISGYPLYVSTVRAPTRVTPWVYNDNGVALINLIHDDIFRMVLLLVLMVLVFPLISCFGKRFPEFMWWIHIFGALLLAVDHIRRSPHAQVFNSPMVAYWLIDWFVGWCTRKKIGYEPL